MNGSLRIDVAALPANMTVAGLVWELDFTNTRILAEEVLQASPETEVDIYPFASEARFRDWLSVERPRAGGSASEYSGGAFVEWDGEYIGGYLEFSHRLTRA